MTGGTVKQFKDALEEMRKIYSFDDEKTRMCTDSRFAKTPSNLTIVTTDEETGVVIEMSKDIPFIPVEE